MAFSAQQKQDGDILVLSLEGNIDEDVKFPSVSASKVRVDLKGIKAINSVGIREWLNWVKPLAESAELTFVNCPKAFIFQANMVEGFLPKGAKVESFYVPFFCEKCDKEHSAAFTIGKEVTLSPGNYSLNYDVKKVAPCKGPDCEVEMDATESKYFQFLKKIA